MNRFGKYPEKSNRDDTVNTGSIVSEEQTPRAMSKQEPQHEPVNQGITLTYKKTKQVQCDPLILERNRIMPTGNGDIIADQLKIVRTQVMNRMKELGARSVLVTSPNPQEGKTFTAINLAINISRELEHTVLLVDANLREPAIQDYFGLTVDAGLADYLVTGTDVANILIHPRIYKLVILPAGKSLTNSSEFLGGSRMSSLVREFNERYDDRFIIYDAPALLESADALVLARYIDCVLIVVEAEKTPAKSLTRALELLGDATIIGIVLNKQQL